MGKKKEKLRPGEHQSVCSCFIFPVHSRWGQCPRATGGRGQCSDVPSIQRHCEHKHRHFLDLKTHKCRFSPTSEAEADTMRKAPVLPSNRQVTDMQEPPQKACSQSLGQSAGSRPAVPASWLPFWLGLTLGPLWRALSPGTWDADWPEAHSLSQLL